MTYGLLEVDILYSIIGINIPSHKNYTRFDNVKEEQKEMIYQFKALITTMMLSKVLDFVDRCNKEEDLDAIGDMCEAIYSICQAKIIKMNEK